jgi:imidazolonepropionase-like amidohydrolase
MPALLISNARLIDGLGGTPRDACDVLVDDGAIAAIAPTGRLSLPDAPHSIQRIDARGLTLMPGFFDCHIHASTDPEQSALEAITEVESAKTLRAVPNLRATLHAGVTTARDLAGADSGFRDSIDRGVISGPRLLVALRILSITGGHGDPRAINGVALDSGPGAGAIADSPAEFVRITREAIREGADWIKVAATGGMGSPRSHPEGGGLSEPEMRAVVDEADRHGVAGVAAHAIGTDGIAAAVRAGVRSIEHGYLIDDTTIEAMIERGTVLVPTLSTLTRELSPNAAPWVRSKRQRTIERASERLRAAIGAGVTVALGTDAGIVAHGANLRELALLVDFGLTPMQAILAGTANAARLNKLDDEVGTIEVGKRADLVATGFDPLLDIHSLALPDAMSLIVQAGHLITRRTETPTEALTR